MIAMTLLAWCVSVILFALSAIHVYWAVGGKGGMKAVLPEIKRDNKPLFIPTPLITFVVAALLFIAALVVLEASHILPAFLPSWITSLGIWTLAVVFLLRSIGDFRYVGFFKRVRGTHFATMDSRLYSPLTLFLGLSILWLAYQG